MRQAARAVLSLNSYGHVLLEENQYAHAGSEKIEATAPELNFGVSWCIYYEIEWHVNKSLTQSQGLSEGYGLWDLLLTAGLAEPFILSPPPMSESLALAVGQEVCRSARFQISTLLGEKRGNHQLQGSLKRKLVVNLSPVNKRPNGVSESSFLDIKRIRVGDNVSVGQGGQHVNNCQSQSMSGTMTVGQGSQRKASSLANSTHASGNDMFNMTLKEVKKEPGETMSCSKHLDGQTSHENMFPNRYGEDSWDQMDLELQELFNELTNISVPPMSDVELENMINATIKQDEPFNIDLGQQSQRGPVRSLQMDKMVIKSEYAAGMNQVPVGSPQMRPSSTGPAFTMATTAMSASSPIPSVPQTQVSQVSSASSRPLPNWQEVSHAQQLKQIAANRQQHALIQQQQQQQNQTANWSALSPSGPSPGPFVQEKIPSPSFRQQQFSPQSSAMLGVPVNGNQTKGMNNYVYKPNTPQSNPMDIIMQPKPQDLNRNFINSAQPPLEQHHGNTKPLFHFNSEQTNQQMPSVLGSQNKPALLHYTQQAQGSAPVQQPQQQQQQQPQPQTAQPLPNQSLQRPPNVTLAMQQKMILQKMQQSQQISGLQYPVSQQHRQVFFSLWGQAKPTPAQGKWQEHTGGGQKRRWACFCQQEPAFKLTSGGWWWGTSPKGVSGEGMGGEQLAATGRLGMEGQDRENQGAESLAQGKETDDTASRVGQFDGVDRAVRAGGEGVKCRKSEGLRVGRILESGNTDCKLGLGEKE
ncbi:hypothetical protein DUI87_16862 [Hirundo rustica rustica]|uniref:Mastermind-like protein 2 n=1 Tax=Hirundo rustica rustica TaxID=333673 RepID=A0A3M0KJL9_HIRRU|nr:hypothetical protein DUI87_16862 [Hirundo rustica rustica]